MESPSMAQSRSVPSRGPSQWRQLRSSGGNKAPDAAVSAMLCSHGSKTITGLPSTLSATPSAPVAAKTWFLAATPLQLFVSNVLGSFLSATSGALVADDFRSNSLKTFICSGVAVEDRVLAATSE